LAALRPGSEREESSAQIVPRLSPASMRSAPASALPWHESQVASVPARSAPVLSVPSRAVASRAVPSRGVPSRGVPSRGVPSRGVPSQGVPSRASRALAAPARRGTGANHHATVQAASESSSSAPRGELEAPQKAPLTPSQSAGLGLELPL
jgi:hypothetical protein